jgi:hypothetical protein
VLLDFYFLQIAKEKYGQHTSVCKWNEDGIFEISHTYTVHFFLVPFPLQAVLSSWPQRKHFLDWVSKALGMLWDEEMTNGDCLQHR